MLKLTLVMFAQLCEYTDMYTLNGWIVRYLTDRQQGTEALSPTTHKELNSTNKHISLEADLL